MHQSSFRILRWTHDDRPYTKDFQDLFCTLMVALPLSQHIQFFQKYPHTFTTREALGHLGNLRFTQSNKRPSPDDPNIMVTTKIATTFSMVEPMARTLCGKFRAARFVEQVGGNLNFGSRDDHFQSPSSIWRMTPKGIRLLESFASRNGVQDRHVLNVLQSPRNCMNLLVLERESENDALKSDRGTIEVIFRRFAGQDGPNTLNGSVSSDSDSFDEASMGLAGVKQSVRKLPNQKNVLSVFSGKDCVDWLMSCSTMVDPREAHDVAKWFIDYGLVQSVYAEKDTPNMKFNEGKNAFYAITPDGQRVAKWVSGRPGATAETMNASQAQMKDSSATRMFNILQSASLRIMFREFLEEAHCLENLDFYQEVRDFLGRWKPVLEKHKAKGTQPAHETLSEILALAYDIYNSYLAPGAPRELNIDHNLRTSVVTRMTRIELPQMEMPKTIDEIMYLYDTVQGSIFKLMASDSVPKFMRDPKYRPLIAEAAANNQIITGFSPAMS